MDYSIARTYILTANYRSAETLLRKAMQLYEREKGEDAIEVALVLNRLGVLFIEEFKFDLAGECLKSALRIRREKLGKVEKYFQFFTFSHLL